MRRGERRDERRDERGSWYLLTGLVLGILMGLLYSWWFRPVSYTSTTPASLSADYKDQYRALIAAAYLANGDLVRAKARLDLLKDADVYQALAEQAQRMLAEGSSTSEARALGLLAVELGQAPAVATLSQQPPGAGLTDLPAEATPSLDLSSTRPVDSPAAFTASNTPVEMALVPTEMLAEPFTPIPTPEEVEATGLPIPTDTRALLATQTPTTAPAAIYALVSQDQVCDPNLVDPLIQVQVQDSSEQPVPGVEIVVSWEGGEDRFFTGLKPELGLGYADFNMTPGISYTLHLEEAGEQVSGLATPECESGSGERYWGSWLLTFSQ